MGGGGGELLAKDWRIRGEEKQTCLCNLGKLVQDPSMNICLHLRDRDMSFFFSFKGHFVFIACEYSRSGYLLL